MRILFVAMSTSIHAARWIGQVCDEGWDLHLFPSIDTGVVHEQFRNLTVHHSFFGPSGASGAGIRARGLYTAKNGIAAIIRVLMHRIAPDYRVRQLVRLIRKLEPDIVHSMEFQSAGYLTLEAKRLLGASFPPWIANNWGSDLYLFGRLAEHRDKIRVILAECDYYSCECQRDVELARQSGLRGKVLPVLPNGGGFDLPTAESLRSSGPTSSRHLIMLKGYQGWAGRALVGLRAIERCADLLKDYQVAVYSATDDVRLATELIAGRTGLRIVVLPDHTPHREILAHHGRARISIGLSIGDAISTSFLEAILMGAFPIQSNTACANEWAEHGRAALFVPPEDPEVVEAALRKALTDDGLVDGAADVNWRTARTHLDYKAIQAQVVEMYQRIVADRMEAS